MKHPMKEPPSKEKPDTGENKSLEDEPKKKGRRKIMASGSDLNSYWSPVGIQKSTRSPVGIH
jgi:hypothetical protein